MCGIVGYIGDKKAKEILVSGLKNLEHRGYDSSGIALKDHDNIEVIKSVGKEVYECQRQAATKQKQRR